MRGPPRVLVISPLPPRRGGLAAWAGILQASAEGQEVVFEDVSGRRADEVGSLVVKTLAAIRPLGRIARHVLFRQIDVVHLNCCLSPVGLWRDLLLAGLVRARALALVVHYRGSVPDCLERLPAASRFALRLLARLASVNLGVTVPSARLLAGFSSSPSACLPNFVEDEWPDRARPANERREADATVRAVCVGRLSRDKGTLDLIETARALPGVEFRLVGEILDEVAEAVESAPPNVIALGHLARAGVRQELLASDLFVLPSHREGFPMAVVEAMGAGLPVVSTRVGAVPSMVREGLGGYLVSPADVPALAEAVRRLAGCRDLARRMGHENRRACRERYTLSAVYPRLRAIHESLAAPGAGREDLGLADRGRKAAGVVPSRNGEASS